MKKRLFLAALCISLLPMFFGHSSKEASSQFSASACSGYVVHFGINCMCEYEVCVCAQGLTVDPEDVAESSPSVSTDSNYEGLFALTLEMLWLRLRAY
jgi:hypothetical protein